MNSERKETLGECSLTHDFFFHDSGTLTTDILLCHQRPIIINIGGREERLCSALDLFSLRGITRTDVAKIFHHRAGIELEKNYGRENPEALERMRTCWSYAVSFMSNILEIEVPNTLKHFTFTSVDDIVRLFQRVDNSQSFEWGKKRNIGFAPIICALLKVCDAYNYVKNSQHIEKLSEDQETLQRMLLEDKSITIERNGDIDEELSAKLWHIIPFTMRGRKKSEARFVSKVLRKIEADEDEILKDGLGLRVFAESTEEIVELARYFINKLKRLKSKLSPKKFDLDNKGLVSDEEITSMRESLELGECNLDKNGLPNEQERNPHQGETFRSLNCTFLIQFQNGIEGLRKRSAEIQFVLDSHENEEGWNNHHIYQLKQRLSIITRLFGYITEKNLRKNLEKTARETQFNVEEIKQRLIEERSIVQIGHAYYSRCHLNRLIHTGMYPFVSEFKDAIV